MFSLQTVTVLWHFCTLFLCRQQVLSLHILIFGDSIDRYGAVEWCQNYARSTGTSWTKGLPLGHFKDIYSVGGFSCHSPTWNVTLSLLPIFGSDPQGPYHFQKVLSGLKVVTSTVSRLDLGIQEYCKQFSSPDIVYFHTVLWDFDRYFRNVSYAEEFWESPLDFNKYLIMKPAVKQHLQHEIVSRLHEIRDYFKVYCHAQQGAPAKLMIGLRSALNHPTGANHFELGIPTFFNDSKYQPPQIGFRACWEHRQHRHLDFFKDLQRYNLSHESSVFFDLDMDIWSKFQHNYTRCAEVLRDSHHPIETLSAQYMHKLLGLQYSSAYIFHDPDAASILHPLLIDKSKSDGSMLSEVDGSLIFRRILLVKEHNSAKDVYFLSYQRQHNSTASSAKMKLLRHGGMTASLLDALYLGVADIYTARSANEWQRVEQGANLPPWIAEAALYGKRFLVHAVDDILHSHFNISWWLVEDNRRKGFLLSNNSRAPEAAQLLRVPIVQGTWDHLQLFAPTFETIPDIYYDTSLVRIHNQRSIYVFLHGLRHPISGLDVLNQHGWSLDHLHILHHDYDLYRVVEGNKID